MSSDPTHGALVVFGSGPGVGRNVAALFAERGFQKVVVISRNADRLAQDAQAVRVARAQTSVLDLAVDIGDMKQIEQALGEIDSFLNSTALECVLFNAARTGKSEFFTFDPAHVDQDLQIAVVGLYTVARWAMPKLLESAKSQTSTPSFLVTSGMLAKDPYPAMFSLATCKAAQYSLVHSLHKEFEPKGVRCGIVIIAGTVSNESKVTDARNIAEECWKMFGQKQGEGSLEVVVADPHYNEHVKNREK